MRIRILSLLAAVTVAASGLCAEEPPPDRLENVATLIFGGRAAEARGCLVEAIAAYEKEHDLEHQAAGEYLLAVTEAALSNDAAARAHFDEASMHFRKAGDFLGTWLVLRSAADLEKREGRYDDALARHEEATDILDEGIESDAPLKTEGVEALGGALGNFGGSNGAPPMPMLSPDLMRVVLAPFAQVMTKFLLVPMARATSHDGLGEVLADVGQLDRAAMELAKAAAFSAKLFGALDSTIYAHIGDLHRRKGELDEARKSFRRALDRTVILPDLPVRNDWIVASLLAELADVEMLAGNLDAALAWNDRALQAVRNAKDPLREAAVLETRGSIFMRGSRFDEAEVVFGQALRIGEDHNDAYTQGMVLYDLGAIAMFRGRYGTAATNLERSIKQFQSIKRPELEAPLWALLTEIYILVDAKESAAATLTRARTLAADSGFRAAQKLVELLDIAHKYMAKDAPPSSVADAVEVWLKLPDAETEVGPELAMILRAMVGGVDLDPKKIERVSLPVLPALGYMFAGKLLVERGQTKAAVEVLQKGLALNPSSDLRSGFLALIGACQWKTGQTAEAIQSFIDSAKAVGKTVDDIRTEDLLAGYLGSSRHLYTDVLIEMLAQQGRYAEAFDFAERARARAFLQLVGNRRIDARGADAQLVREADALRLRIAESERQLMLMPTEDSLRKIREDRKRFAGLMTRIQASNPEYASLATVEPVSLDKIRAQLPPDTTLLSYYASSQHVHAWVIDRQSVDYAALPADAFVAKDAECWATLLGAKRGSEPDHAPCGAAGNSEELFDRLVAPLQNRIAGHRLIIVPYGTLHHVPFGALRNRKTGRYLVEDYTIVYAPSASALAFLRDKESPVHCKALILGDPQTVAEERLRGAEREAKLVAKMFATEPLLGAKATESRLFELHGEVDLLHIAAHGQYDKDNPLFSRILLARDDRRDGDLQVHEILGGLDLSGVNLVVLSACLSALGKNSRGDDVVGLTRALLYAGTPGVVSALWSIDDEASTTLITSFYRHLLAGEAAAEALQHAQVEMLHSERYAAPGYWAAFTLTGDPQGRWNTR